MNIGITGAAGFLGANLLRHLCSPNGGKNKIIPFRHRRTANPLTDDLHLRHEPLDILSAEEVAEKTRGLDVLFHAAGRIGYDRRSARQTWDVNVLGTRNVFDAAVRNGIGKIVYLSSICVLGPGGPGLSDETGSPYADRGNPISFRNRGEALEAVGASGRGEYGFIRRMRVPYFDSKLAAYELAGEYHRSKGLPVVTILPGTAVGGGDTGYSITRLLDLVYRSRLLVTLPGATSFVAAADVARGARLAALHGRIGESYIITGLEGDNLSYRSFMKLTAGVVNRRYARRCRTRFLVFPPAMCRVLAGPASALLRGAGLNRGLILSGSVSHRFSGGKAARELGYHPRTPLEEAVKSCLDFYLYSESRGGSS